MKCRKLIVLAVAIGLNGCVWAYRPIIDGARAELDILVVDDEGVPVDSANLNVWFATGPVKGIEREGKTDEAGRFSAKCKTTGSIWIEAEKDGYYKTRLHVDAQKIPYEEVKKTRKWSNGPIETRVVLKKIKTPAKLVMVGGRSERLQWPATNTVLGFDLERFDWCPPYGEGQYDDLQLEFDFWRSPTNWFQVYTHLTLTMTNGVDGLYLAPVDGYSELKRCYHANPDADYQRRLEFVYDRRTGEVTRDIPMPVNQYMVFRTRTQTNEAGEVTSANYGLIFEKGQYEWDWEVSVGFNPIPNDPNLESTATPPWTRPWLDRKNKQRAPTP